MLSPWVSLEPSDTEAPAFWVHVRVAAVGVTQLRAEVQRLQTDGR